MLYHVVKVKTVDFCYDFAVAMLLCKEGEEDVFLVVIGEREECVGMLDPLLDERFLLRGVAVDDGNIGEINRELFANCAIVVNDFELCSTIARTSLARFMTSFGSPASFATSIP